MKIEFFENMFGASFSLTPETPAEVAQVLRFTRNAKAEKPDVKVYFSSDQPTCNIWMRKVQEKSQVNSISNRRNP